MPTSMATHSTREAWLTTALWSFIDQHFIAAGFEVPSNIRVSCSFPSTRALAPKRTRLGECWAKSESTDGTFEILVSPILDDPIRVLGVLLHEVVHTTVGLDVRHQGPFVKCAAAIGLIPPWVAAVESEDLKVEIASWLKSLGVYPHARLNPTFLMNHIGPKQTTRMRPLECDKCGCKIRTTWKWMKLHGFVWPCPCGHILVCLDRELV